jgi:nucleotide-binding universal stress UspA family protein
MSVFDRVVVGVDGTDFGFEALRQTLVLGPPGGAVYAVTALDPGVAVHAGFNMSDVAAQLEEEADRARATAAEIMGDRLNCTTKVVRGDAKSVLRHACAEYDATFLALGGRSSSRFLGMMAGETAGTLLHDAALSVLFARPLWGQRWHPNRVVVGVDSSEFSLAALAVADDLAERLGSALEVVTATGGKPVEREGAWAERVTAWDPGHPFAALRDRSTHADLLILGSRGLHGVRALGSVSERVAHGAHCSALIIHPSPPNSRTR